MSQKSILKLKTCRCESSSSSSFLLWLPIRFVKFLHAVKQHRDIPFCLHKQNSQNNIHLSLWPANECIMLCWDLLNYVWKTKSLTAVSVYLPTKQPIYHFIEHLNNVRAKLVQSGWTLRIPGGSKSEGFWSRHAASRFSAVVSVEGATAAGGSEVDGFAEGGGQVGFSERLWHRLQEEDNEKDVWKRSRCNRTHHVSCNFSYLYYKIN